MKTLIVVLAVLAGMAACGETADRPATESNAVVYVDVRSAEEFAAGHVQGARNIAVEEMQQRWPELEPYRDRQIIVYCRTGRRSVAALEVLRANGFTRLQNGGGFDSLAATGLPVTRGM